MTPAPRETGSFRPRLPAALLALGVLVAACIGPSPSPSTTTSGVASPSARSSATQLPTVTPAPTTTPVEGLVLPEPSATDPRAISYSVTVEVEAGASGRLVVVVTNLGPEIVKELVLRWPTEVRDTVFLAPFQPSQQRIREGGDPLVQDWTKWVDGPGELGEPAGTTSLGWGPLLAGGTLTIPVLATRVAPGPLTFDLQILAGEAVLTSDGEPAWLKVSVP